MPGYHKQLAPKSPPCKDQPPPQTPPRQPPASQPVPQASETPIALPVYDVARPQRELLERATPREKLDAVPVPGEVKEAFVVLATLAERALLLVAERVDLKLDED